MAWLILLCLPAAILSAQPKLESHHVVLKGGGSLDLQIPAGYRLSVAAEGLGRLRFMTRSPDGRLFATDMHSLDDNRLGRIYLFEDWDGDGKRFRKTTIFANGLRNPNQVMFVTERGTDYIYIAETDKLSRYPYKPGDRALSGTPQVLARFPDYGLSYKYGGWHLTRSLAQHGGRIYVSVGSSCNACIEGEDIRATILEMNPDGSGQRIYASGLRNSVGIRWVGDNLWATFMGRDGIGPDKPEDLFGKIIRGRHHGWPFYYQFGQHVYRDKAMIDSAKARGVRVPAAPPVASCGFKAHSAPLGFEYFSGFDDPLFNRHFLVALHGSTSVWRQRGNAIVLVTGTDKYVPVVAGFLTGKDEIGRGGRPCDVMMNDACSFFVTDDKNGVLYYISKCR